jgi:manganese-dependent inorganic pyrophosphatase
MSALLVTDVVSQTSLLVLSAPESFHNLISYPEAESNIYRLEGVVSRKKQLLPFLTHSLALLK